MSTSTFKIIKQCENCGNMFESQKRTTRFCTHKCNSQNYKLRKKLERKKEVEKETFKKAIARPKTNALSLELIKQKEFLKVKELSILFNCSKQTIYRMINSNEINAVNLSTNLTRIRRKDIEQLFEKPILKEPDVLTTENCYTMDEIIEKYKVSRNTIYNYTRKHNIKRFKKGKFSYYSKVDIDKLFIS